VAIDKKKALEVQGFKQSVRPFHCDFNFLFLNVFAIISLYLLSLKILQLLSLS